MNLKQYWWSVKTLRQAYKVKKLSGFPATAIAAIAVLETWYGQAIPVDIKTGEISNNLFGIKCLLRDGEIVIAGDNGCVFCYTHEWSKARGRYLTTAYFRAYKSYESCFLDFVRVIINSKKGTNQRYAKALGVLDNSEKFVEELWKAGYATDKDYLKNIVPIIRQLNRIPVWVLKL